jgi:hypothetical protein
LIGAVIKVSNALNRLAKRLENDTFFLASALRTYATSEGLDYTGLAHRLNCDVSVLSTLSICRRPTGAAFREEVLRIAERFNVKAGTLAEAIRRADSLETLRLAQPERGLLMAARDADADSERSSTEDTEDQ